MLKTAFQIGVELAIKEAGLSPEEIEKISGFLGYRDLAEAFPTFRRWLGLNPEMANRVLETAKKVAKKRVYRLGSSLENYPGLVRYNPRAFKRAI